LTRSGENVSLTPKATDILALLLQHAGQLVEKEELMREVWPDSFVEEQNLTQNIFVLRRALGDGSGGAKYIETVPRRGYRFVAQVERITCGETPVGMQGSDVTSDLTAPPILAVLPFINATGDAKLEYLAEGITENIINNLSRISKLRVVSRSAVFRYKGREVDPLVIGQGLGVDVLLTGNMYPWHSGFSIRAELVDVKNNWQLWGKNFDCNVSEILEVQDEIARQISSALRLRLTGEEEKKLTTRHTENSKAYQAYLEGRYRWSSYTRVGIEEAIVHFRRAIDFDQKYVLSYSGIIDCYLRLATGYLPPGDEFQENAELRRHADLPEKRFSDSTALRLDGADVNNTDNRIRLRHEWDWKGVERELRRATQLKADYPATHQWYAAFLFARNLFLQSQDQRPLDPIPVRSGIALLAPSDLPPQIPSADLTPTERLQVLCAIAREQIDVGNLDAACIVLKEWWTFGQLPKLQGLAQPYCADLLYTTGTLAGWVASTDPRPSGQKHGEALLAGSIALFEHLGSTIRAAEACVELGLCYYRQGMFDLGRATLLNALSALGSSEPEVRCLALIRLASLERHAGRLRDALTCLQEAEALLNSSGPWAAGRCHLEMASTFKDLATSDGTSRYLERAMSGYQEAFNEFEAIGNHRLAAVAENNHGYLLLMTGRLEEAAVRLQHSRRVFDAFGDKVRRAQVDDTLARLHLSQGNLDMAGQHADKAIEVLTAGDENALFAEALTTKGLVLCKRGRFSEAKRVLTSAHEISERCGDTDGSGRALLVMLEEMREHLGEDEREEAESKLTKIISGTDQTSLAMRVRNVLEKGLR
jgi:DNA-binding winged helix-turn-helix (wHTH) protein/tetratricopeptide (TPR) repeat protein